MMQNYQEQKKNKIFVKIKERIKLKNISESGRK